ncbi:hypothetical protein BDN70DRAFT_881599 [Pholiota conissans]|uniref:Uncharacterized protein n=1 Tax=Pholiota conissans TaxID=109636 RepID=A0A9P5YXT6_9AGAR|nr:hypothetical protein BDN70DRAFT_881599 [Pholiota conissans]
MPSLPHIQQLQKRLFRYSSESGLPTSNILQSLHYPLPSGQNLRLPLWVLEYWTQAYHIIEYQQMWTTFRGRTRCPPNLAGVSLLILLFSVPKNGLGMCKLTSWPPESIEKRRKWGSVQSFNPITSIRNLLLVTVTIEMDIKKKTQPHSFDVLASS